jgi:D-alanyl-D-alanine carboxypeptidase (penicillin-binding protein 5/6)
MLKNILQKTRVLIILLGNILIINSSWAILVTPEQLNLSTNTFILMDYNSGRVLLERDSNKKLEPASLTKIMTMYVVDHEIKSGRLSLDDEVQISKKAWQATGSRMFVNLNSKVKVADLIKGIIIQSGNDASIALAEHIAGSEQVFAGLMNDYAATLGMENSHFVNATGLSSKDHYTTAKDLAILSKAIIDEHPESYLLYSQKSFSYNGIHQNNRNRLLWRNTLVDGIKTGQTDNAGYCLSVSAVQDNTRLIGVILGSKTEENRFNDANKLLTWGFRFFTSYKVYQHGNILANTRIWGGNKKNIQVGLAGDTYLSIPKQDLNRVKATLTIPNVIKAPIKQGSPVGTYVIKLHDEIIAEYPAVSLSSVKPGNLFAKIKDQLIIYFNMISGNNVANS